MKSILKGQAVDAWVWSPLKDVESAALDQLKRVAALPYVFHHIAVMPDVHWGKGATVGSVIAMKNAVSPAAVGVDIGCGMIATKLKDFTASHLPDDLKSLRIDLEWTIPVGFNSNKEILPEVKKYPIWQEFNSLNELVHKLETKAALQCGTLGAGNHFIEVCLDKDQNVWIMLHSGSRNIGKEIADIHIKTAKKLLYNQSLPDKDLAVFIKNTLEYKNYIHDLKWAQEYALYNRQTMLNRIIRTLSFFFKREIKTEEFIQCHHNYVSEEVHYNEDVLVTRKGAISAKKDELGIIPGSMGTKSYIVKGLGNPESFMSASHGAGRVLSRGAAKRTFNQEDVFKQTAGVECRKDLGIADELPGSYKDIDQVIANENDLVEIVTELKQVLCVKG